MIKRIVFILVLIVTGVSYAQTSTPTRTPTATMTAFPSGANVLTCNGLPCGSLIWTLPAPPAILSPTPLSGGNPSIGATATYTPSRTPTQTPTITPTGAFVNQVNGFVTNLNALTSATPMMTGTPYQIESNVTTFFGYIRAITQADFGVLNPLITFLIIVFGLTLVVKITLFMIPIYAFIFGLVRKLIELIPGE